ncbi:MAG: elongation factor G [Bacteroidetes bacterium GWF2_38_335]|nr:MAG: elongation factor G [Bacteroidetes bacterium GWF2_38_335]OFY81370.1 MAG: elongation factor G [Bacteroidetes bacterium RIFOXYA12_FULL_38_20]HBS85493.1 elongation factor G [Bacteroidales bacterium]
MKVYQTNEIKNIALLGNSRSGKTTLAEAMLFKGGVIDRRGDTDSHNTVSDFNKIEHENEISVFSTVLYSEYKNKKINFIDNPGADDFCGGPIMSMRPSDCGVMVINAQNGVEVGTEIQNRHANNNNFPFMLVVNFLDHENANWEKTVEHLKERLGSKVIVAQYPVETGSSFNSIIDVVSMKMYKYPAGGGKAEILDIPESEKDKAAAIHGELIEKAAEGDESLMEIFFEKDTLTPEEMQRGIKAGLISNGIAPVFCISAKKDIGVDRLMEFIADTMPSPDEMPAPLNTDEVAVECKSSGPAVIFVFKSSIEEHVGEINYFKVMSGELNESIDLVNQNTGSKERLSQLYVCAGKNRVKVAKLCAGDIGATVKLKNTKTNNTLTVNNASMTFAPIAYPEPKFRTAIRPLSESDDEKLGESLVRMSKEDPTITYEYSKELKQILVYGQGEYHLNILKWHFDNIYKIPTEFYAPKIPYRETITKVAQADYRHKKQSGGAGQFGEVHMIIEPYIEGAPEPNMFKIQGKELKISIRDREELNMPWGGKLMYYNCIVGGSIDARFMPAILKGINEKMEEGPLTGSYARDIKVYVYDGKMHPVDSNEISFRLAGRNAFSQAFKAAGPKIMEPVYDVEVFVPGDRMGDVMSDLQGRRAIVQGMSSESGFEKISAKIPLAEMNKYSTSLSSISGGRAMYTMKFAEYAQVPPDIQDKLLKEYEAEQKDE